MADKRLSGQYAWDCGDEVLDRLRNLSREDLRDAIAREVLAALQYHSQTLAPDHIFIYFTNQGKLAVDFQLPGCRREIDLQEVLVGFQLDVSAEAEEGTISLERLAALFRRLADHCDSRLHTS